MSQKAQGTELLDNAGDILFPLAHLRFPCASWQRPIPHIPLTRTIELLFVIIFDGILPRIDNPIGPFRPL
jgi:hypothetical protein